MFPYFLYFWGLGYGQNESKVKKKKARRETKG